MGQTKKTLKNSKKIFVAEAGSLFLWSSFILHGTQPQQCDVPRISLISDIKTRKKNNNNLMNELLKNIQGKLSMSVVRDDIDLNSRDHKQVKFQKILK